MKYIKWIEFTLKLGICYIIRKKKVVINSEQKRIPKKGRAEEEKEKPLS